MRSAEKQHPKFMKIMTLPPTDEQSNTIEMKRTVQLKRGSYGHAKSQESLLQPRS